MNPNPSGWSNGYMFIDLHQVVYAYYFGSNLYVAFKSDLDKDPRILPHIAQDDWKSLSEALLIYRSHR